MPREVDEALHAWTNKTPAMAAIREAAAGPGAATGAGDKGSSKGKASAAAAGKSGKKAKAAL